MGNADIESKKFMRDNAHFADVVNYFVFGGRQIVLPDDLSPLDTAEVVVPYGNGARSPVQKYRDTAKLWSVMTDDRAVYVILGAENQTDVHYAMPVRSGLYDFLNYAGQVSEAGKRYRKKAQKENGSAIRLTSGEYLSGFRKEDKLDEAKNNISRFRGMDPESVELINAVTGSDLKIVVNEEGKVDVCTAIDEMRKESRNEGRIEGKIEGHREGKIEGSLETLVHLVQKGLISLYDAALEADLTPDEFSLKMKGIN